MEDCVSLGFHAEKGLSCLISKPGHFTFSLTCGWTQAFSPISDQRPDSLLKMLAHQAVLISEMSHLWQNTFDSIVRNTSKLRGNPRKSSRRFCVFRWIHSNGMAEKPSAWSECDRRVPTCFLNSYNIGVKTVGVHCFRNWNSPFLREPFSARWGGEKARFGSHWKSYAINQSIIAVRFGHMKETNSPGFLVAGPFVEQILMGSDDESLIGSDWHLAVIE
jgi:hypothetical protein